MGYDNAFKYDTKRSYRGSVGLGATIGQSLLNFGKNLDNLSAIKKGSDNAIGTIMRLHPIPIFFHDNLTECLKCASSQSYLTHNGIEASDCAKIMAYFMYEGINMQTKPKTAKEFLDYCTDPKNEDYKMLYGQLETIGGKCLLESKKEELKDFVKNEYNLTIDDRNWNWKEKLYIFSLTRVNKSRGYVGSYAMDSLAIALSYMYFSQDFMSMMTALVNIGGDSDSFGAVAGGIAGAYYGIKGIKKEWHNAVFKWDDGESILRVFHMLRINPLIE
jgi:ADP-ribosylglycohydrolase